MKRILIVLLVLPLVALCQGHTTWSHDGNSYYVIEAGEIIEYRLPSLSRHTVATRDELKSNGEPLPGIKHFSFSEDRTNLLVFANTRKVWRLETRGDYWVLDLASRKLTKLGAGLPPSGVYFAKFSPDSRNVAYVSQNNVFAENLETGKITRLTNDGTRKLINGTFDWVYEEEFFCRDGIQWSPDSKHLAFWQVDATKIRDFYMINYTDSVYSRVIPVEYPTAGHSPSPARIGVVNIESGETKWLPIPGDPQEHYLPRMEWNTATELFVQQLNRKQNICRIFSVNPFSGSCKLVFSETDQAWIDIITPWQNAYTVDFRHRFLWLNRQKEFLWMSEMDGWWHAYRIDKEGKMKLITHGDFDVMEVEHIDESGSMLYFIASPGNATQKYLYRTRLDGTGKAELVSPSNLKGTHGYQVSPNGKFARHTFSNTSVMPMTEWVSLPQHRPLNQKESISASMPASQSGPEVEFFKVRTEEGVEMDGWMVKPGNFDTSKKYPVLFFVYTEPAGANVTDTYGVANNALYKGSLSEDGYIYISLDNRGTPAPKGRTWRKSIYRQLGRVNIRDQAMAAKEILKWPFVDPDRIAVWGWSGGGSATLHLLFQYPQIYGTGIAVAAVVNQLTYDNIYQERFMGLPQENPQDFAKGSPIEYAKNLQGNLLYIHGTGDDNVHYSNAEMLINELVRHGKQFELMVYPNRTHSMQEGEGTYDHMSELYTNFLKTHCPPGGK